MQRQKLLLGTALVLLIPIWVMATDPTSILIHGSETNKDNRIIMAIVGDGFTVDYQDHYNTLVNTYKNKIFSTIPFSKYSKFFNLYRINAISNDLGIGSGSARDTALGMYTKGLTLPFNSGLFYDVLDKAYGPGIDFPLVVGYTYPGDAYAGSAWGNVAKATDTGGYHVLLHELGHTIVGLADEYNFNHCDHGPNGPSEPGSPNISAESDATKVKWKHWTGYQHIGTYEGGGYCKNGIYRNHPLSKMFNAYKPFYAVNSEALALKFYEHVDPIDSISPSNANTITSDECETLNFSVDTVLNVSDNNIEWFINDEKTTLSTNATLSLDSCSDLEEGTHTVEVKVTDDVRYSDGKRVIRKDPNNRSQSSRSWTVINAGPPHLAIIPLPGRVLQTYWPVCEGSSTAWFYLTNSGKSTQVTVQRESSADGKVGGYTPPVNQTTDTDILLVGTQGTVTVPSTFTLAKNASIQLRASATTDSDGINGTVKFTFYMGSEEVTAVYFREIDTASGDPYGVCNDTPITKDPIANQTVTTGHSVTVNLANAFEDPDGDTLTFTALSTDSTIATASVNASTLTVTGVSVGSTSVTVTATDTGDLSVAQTFMVTVPNSSPTTIGTLSPVTVKVGGNASNIDVSGAFSDPDGDTLTYTATSSATGKATVSVSDSTVTVTPVAEGSATVTVTVTDPGGLSATQTFTVTILPENQAPVANNPIRDHTKNVGEDPITGYLPGHFSDPDGDNLSFKVSSSDTSVATGGLYGGGNYISVTIVGAGTATITVTATDPGGLFVTDDFIVTVNSTNNAPTAVGSLSDVTLLVGGIATNVDVSSAFSDPDGDTLTYTATSSATDKATVSISGSTVTVAPVVAGSATITVTATDPGGLSATQTFTVTVSPVNQPPIAVGSLSDVTLLVNGSATTVDASSAFSDPDGDTLIYTATSSATDKATVSISGSTVTVTPVVAGSATITVTATDPGGLSATQTFSVTVAIPSLIITPPTDRVMQTYWPVCEEESSPWFSLTNNLPSMQVTVQRESSADGKVGGYTPPVNQTTDPDISLESSQGTLAVPSTFTLAENASLQLRASAASDSDGYNGTVKFTFYVGNQEVGAVYFREIDTEFEDTYNLCNRSD